MDVWGIPVDRPSTNSLRKRKAGHKWELAETRDGYYLLWCPSFFDANRLWPATFFNLEAVGGTRLDDHDSQLEIVFFKQGPPHKLVTNNDPAFCSREFRACAHEWGVNLQFRCMYAPTGNSIAECCHCTVKQIAVRMQYPIQEAFYWRSVTPKDSESPQTAPANRIHQYELRVKDVDTLMTFPNPKYSFHQIGNHVWVKVPQSWCTTKFDRVE